MLKDTAGETSPSHLPEWKEAHSAEWKEAVYSPAAIVLMRRKADIEPPRLSRWVSIQNRNRNRRQFGVWERKRGLSHSED